MAIGFARIVLEEGETKVITLKGYDGFILDSTCDEIRTYAKELDLSCLRYLDGATSCLFGYDQCQDILTKEIPLLRAKNLTRHAQKTLDELEYVIKYSHPWGFLSFDGD